MLAGVTRVQETYSNETIEANGSCLNSMQDCYGEDLKQPYRLTLDNRVSIFPASVSPVIPDRAGPIVDVQGVRTPDTTKGA